jgi:hypothetical protein
MRRYRFSICGIMVMIVLLGVACAALRTPSRFWANVWFSVALAAVTLAIPAAVSSQGGRRAFWVGFATCGWVYFLVSLGPWFDREIGYQLLTTTILDILSPHIVQNEYLLQGYIAGFNPPSAPGLPTPWQAWNLPDFRQSDTWSVGYTTLHSPWLYLRIGHAGCCLLLAYLGGEIARYVHAARSEPQAVER